MKLDLLKTINLPTAALDLCAAADGRTLYAACHDGVYEVNVESATSSKLATHESYVSGLALLPDGILISAGYDGVLQWHDLAARKVVRKVAAHEFWSWQMALSPDGTRIASVTGQYLPGGYKYEPAAEREPSVRVFNTQTGELVQSFAHTPPTLSVAFSHDGKQVAAGNLMGEVRVWDLATGNLAANWTTPAFTSWGIIKSHHYVGGIFAMTFAPDDDALLVAGMGPMNDPMAGNGKQTWQRFAWRENPARKLDEIHDDETGRGLMETIAYHPSREYFTMGGRMAQGAWNLAFFNAKDGARIHALDTKMRITQAVFRADGQQLFLAGATGQGKKTAEGKYPDYGRLAIYGIA